MIVQYVVAPHRGQLGSGIWSSRRDGVLVGVYPSRDLALGDATERAFDEWNRHGRPAAVYLQWMGSELSLEREFGRPPKPGLARIVTSLVAR